MADFYVDNAAGGTGDGTSPTDARTHIIGVNTFADGDYIWIRKTHVESDVATARLGTTHTIGRKTFFVGWPGSGDPFYDRRPAAGVSAGWDSDHAATAVYSVYGLDLPTLSSSRNGNDGLLTSGGNVFANLCYNQLGANDFGIIGVTSTSFHDNVITLRQYGPQTSHGNQTYGFSKNMGKVTIVVSGPTIPILGNVEQLVIHSASVVSGGLTQCLVGPRDSDGVLFGRVTIRHLVNQSNSLSHLIYRDFSTIPIEIERCTGIAPYSNYMVPGNIGATGFTPIARVGDYFGLGPINCGYGGVHVTLANSAVAMYNSQRAMQFQIFSGGAPDYQKGIGHEYPLRQLVTVSAGISIGFRVPMYMDATAAFSLSNGLLRARLLCAGGGGQWMTASNFLAGSSTPWSGTGPTGGTAYTMVCTWTPSENATAAFEVSVPLMTTSAATLGKMWAGVPY